MYWLFEKVTHLLGLPHYLVGQKATVGIWKRKYKKLDPFCIDRVCLQDFIQM